MSGTLNVIKADLRRLIKDNGVLIVLIIGVVLSIFSAVFIKLLLNIVPDEADMMANLTDYYFTTIFLGTFSLGTLGFFAVLASSMFVGKDFSFNTIRNKIISGNSRIKIYLSAFAVNIILGLAYYIIMGLATFLVCLMMFGSNQYIGQMLAAVALNLPCFIAFIAMGTFISYTTKSRALGIVINLLIIIIVAGIISTLLNLSVIFSELGSEAAKVNPFLDFLRKVSLFTLPDEILAPVNSITGEVIFDFNASLILRSIFSPLVHIIIFTGLGAFLFRRADIK